MAERLLMRGCREHEAEIARPPHAFLDLRPTGVDRHRHELGSAGEQAVACSDGTWILEPYLVAGIEEHAPDQVEGLLRAADDEDLPALAGDAAIGAQMRRDRLAQAGMAEGSAIAHHILTPAAPMLRGKPRPLRHRKGVECWKRGVEGARRVRQARPVTEAADRDVHRLRPALLLMRDELRRRRWRPRALGAQRVAREGAGADPRRDEASGGKPLESVDHGRSRRARVRLAGSRVPAAMAPDSIRSRRQA